MNILIISPHINVLNPYGGVKTRIFTLIQLLIENGHRVIVLEPYHKEIEKPLGKNCIVYYFKEITFLNQPGFYFTDINLDFIRMIRKIKKREKLDIIQVEFPWGIIIPKLFFRKKKIIYDSQGVEGDFIKVTSQLIPNRILSFLFLKLFQKPLQIFEKIVCKICNYIITVAENDKVMFGKKYGINRHKIKTIQTISTIEPDKLVEYKKNKEKIKKKFNLKEDSIVCIFHGSLPHVPNREAFDIIVDRIAKKIAKKNVVFVLAGGGSAPIEKFRKDNVVSLGFVEDLYEFFAIADVALLPIVSGSGMRTKYSDYICANIPVVSTVKGVEGFNITNGKEALISKNVDDEFLKNLNILLENKELRENMKQHQKRFYTRYLSKSVYLKKFIQVYHS
ncbi:MAG: glycosyltransferase [Promethearchaeota archaeon]